MTLLITKKKRLCDLSMTCNWHFFNKFEKGYGWGNLDEAKFVLSIILPVYRIESLKMSKMKACFMILSNILSDTRASLNVIQFPICWNLLYVVICHFTKFSWKFKPILTVFFSNRCNPQYVWTYRKFKFKVLT